MPQPTTVIVRNRRPSADFVIVHNSFARCKLPPRAVKVGLFLLSHSEEFQVSQLGIGRIIGMGETAVAAALKDLEDAGYLARETMRDERGYVSGTRYSIGDQPESLTVDSVVTDSVTTESTEPKKTNSKEEDHFLEEDLSLDADASADKSDIPTDFAQKNDQLLDRFDEFYAVYPRHVGRGQAERAWKTTQRAKIDPQVLIDAAAAYAVYRQGEPKEFTAHPATWLNGKRWLDELPGRTQTPVGYQPAPRVPQSEWERLAASAEARREEDRKGEPGL